MNAIRNIQKIVPVSMILMLGLTNAHTALGADPVIHAAWDGGGTPVEGQDYFVFTTGQGSPDFPSVELRTGNLGWRVWSTDTDNLGNVGDIGTITSPHPANFVVNLKDDQGGSGARNVKGVLLDPQGSGSDTNYSSLAEGKIDGDVAGGFFLQQSSGGTGGEITGGGMFFSPFRIIGDVLGDTEVAVITGDGFTINGDLFGDIDVTDKIESAALVVIGDVSPTSTITVASIVSGGMVLGHTITFGSGSDIAGTIILQNGIPQNGGITVVGEFTGTINLSGQEVAGSIDLWLGGSGAIRNGGALSGSAVLARVVFNTFSGTATFSSVESGGRVRTLDSADLAGTVTIGGDMLGIVSVDGSLNSTGRVLIDGLCDGPITIGEETAALSQIQMSDGLGPNGSITINDTRGNFNANGDIYVGQTGAPPLPFPVVFDGSILVKDDLTGGGGDLNGGIKVVGCHSTTDDLDICICGSVNGFVGVLQTGCPNQVGWSCVSGCP